MIPLPTIAFAIPPPVAPNSDVDLVKKSRLIAPTPLRKTEPTTITSTATASRAATVERDLHQPVHPLAAPQVAAGPEQRVARRPGRSCSPSASVAPVARRILDAAR